MILSEKIIGTAVLAGRLALCPGDDIFMAVAGTMKAAETGEGMPPAAFLYDKSPVLRVKKRSNNGDEELEPVPDEIIVIDFSELETEALSFSSQELETLNV